MQIGQLARRAGVNPRTIRFYESKGLIAPASRGSNGYRQYTDKELGVLLFIRRAQTMGLALGEIGDLLRYRAAGSCAGLRSRLGDLLAAKIAELRKRSAELLAFSRELETIRRRLQQAARGGPVSAPALCDCLSLTAKATSGRGGEKNGRKKG
ncbi:MAG: MerR family transcriptional regulator [Acidobacteriota bacterium]